MICNISFDKKIPPKTQNTHLCESAIIIITEFSNEFCGFLVDQVIDVVYFSETDLSAPPNYFPGNWISSIAITEDKIYLVMDAENFIKTELNQ